tara:strand:+ start:326 stop:523 length:198 start_codon:yes stop_codon:yes gene_type:complete
MITVTCLNGESITVNPDQILQVRPGGGKETLVEFMNGRSMRVTETTEELTALILDWQRKRWMPVI